MISKLCLNLMSMTTHVDFIVYYGSILILIITYDTVFFYYHECISLEDKGNP